MLLGLNAFADWVQQSNWNSDTGTMDTYWVNRVTGETSLSAPPPDPVPNAPAPVAAPEYYVWGRSGADDSHWINIADISQAIQYNYDGTPTTPAPGVPVRFAGFVNESTLGLRGDVFIDASGNYYVNG